MSDFKKWYARALFVSSTFIDMHSERGILQLRVFPALAERLKDRFHYLEPIDLRWGAASSSGLDPAIRDLQILEVCLGEIKRSRPFLVGIIGDRYGWCPTNEKIQTAAIRADMNIDVRGRSVTELEILYGVINDHVQKTRSRFYFREPLPYGDMDAETAAVYCDEYSPDPIVRASYPNLGKLKSRIQKAVPNRCRTYPAAWDSARNKVAGLEKFEEFVLEDLWVDLQRETEKHLQSAPKTWQGADLRELGNFAEDRSRGLIGRDGLVSSLVSFAKEEIHDSKKWGLCITGNPGSGKSSLFGKVFESLVNDENEGKLLLLSHSAGISGESIFVHRMLRRWISKLSSFLNTSDIVSEESKSEEIIQEFSALLAKTSRKIRVVVLVDALDQFEPGLVTEYLTWVPWLWPENVHLIATSTPCVAVDSLNKRPGVESMSLPSLTEEDSIRIAKDITKRYHRKFDENLAEALMSVKTTSGIPAALNPLWLSLAVEELNMVDGDTYSRLKDEFKEFDFDKTEQLIMAVAKSYPPDIHEMLLRLLSRAGKAVPEQFALKVFHFLAMGRTGWRESDLRALIKPYKNIEWDDLDFAVIRRLSFGHLVQRGDGAQWDFHHRLLREAIRDQLTKDSDYQMSLHQNLANHLLGLKSGDPLRDTETMHHLIHSNNVDSAAQYFGGELSTLEVAGACEVMKLEILKDKSGTQNPGIEWIGKLCRNGTIDSSGLFVLFERLLYDLNDLLVPGGNSVERKALNALTTELVTKLDEDGPNNPVFIEGKATSLSMGGLLAMENGDTETALDLLGLSARLFSDLAEKNSENRDFFLWSLSESQLRLGELFYNHGDLPRAEDNFKKVIETRQSRFDLEGDEIFNVRGLGIGYARMGDVQNSMGNQAGAIESYEKGMEFFDIGSEADPQSRLLKQDRAVTKGKIADIHWKQGRLPKALELNDQALTILTSLSISDPTDSKTQRIIAVVHGKTGQISLEMREQKKALIDFGKALDIGRTLHEMDPGNTEWARDVAVYVGKMGHAFFEFKDFINALPYFLESVGISESLRIVDPTDTTNLDDQSNSLRNIASIYLNQGKIQEAENYLQKSSDVVAELEKMDNRNLKWRLRLANINGHFSLLYRSQNEYQKAEKHEERAIEILEKLLEANDANFEWQHMYVVALYNMGSIQSFLRDPMSATDYYYKCYKLLSEFVDKEIELPKDLNDIALRVSRVVQIHSSIGKFLNHNQDEAVNTLNTGVNELVSINAIAEAFAIGHMSIVMSKKNTDVNRLRFADALNNMGTILVARELPNESIQFFEEALQIRVQLLGNIDGLVAESLYNLGVGLEKIDRKILAASRFAFAQYIYTVSDEGDFGVGPLVKKALVGLLQDDFSETMEPEQPGAMDTNELFPLANTLDQLGQISSQKKEAENAVFYFSGAIKCWLRFRDTHPNDWNTEEKKLLMAAFGNRGDLLFDAKEYEKAMSDYKAMETLATEVDEIQWVLAPLHRQAHIHLGQDRNELAIDVSIRMIELSRLHKRQDMEIKGLDMVVLAFINQGDTQAASAYLKEMEKINLGMNMSDLQIRIEQHRTSIEGIV